MWSTEEKNKFRTRKAWKDFRAQELANRGYRCECCGSVYKGKKSKGLQLHHKNPEKYDLLKPELFSLLCSTDHDAVELLERRLKSEKPTLKNVEKWVALYGEFLAQPSEEIN